MSRGSRIAEAHAAHRAASGQGRGPMPRPLSAVLGILAGVAGMLVAWSLAYLATEWLWGVLAVHPAELLRQLATAFLGIVFIAVPSSVVALWRQPREGEFFGSVLGVMRRIAQGDFTARVEPAALPGRHPFSQFVHGINDMAEDLARMESLRQEFISNVSHEIQSPLTSIGGFARALHDEGLTPQDRLRYLEIIEAESERLSKLSDNLMRLTALEAGDPPLVRRSFRLDQQLRRVVLASEPQWSGSRLDLEVDASPLRVVADEDLLEHVWANLVHNAVKFTPPGGTIRVRARRQGTDVLVEVEDSGIGIAAQDQERVFERFFKADRSRERARGGSGLGLALARRIVELHGGRIGVVSALGQGATFRVELPQAPADDQGVPQRLAPLP